MFYIPRFNFDKGYKVWKIILTLSSGEPGFDLGGVDFVNSEAGG